MPRAPAQGGFAHFGQLRSAQSARSGRNQQLQEAADRGESRAEEGSAASLHLEGDGV